MFWPVARSPEHCSAASFSFFASSGFSERRWSSCWWGAAGDWGFQEIRLGTNWTQNTNIWKYIRCSLIFCLLEPSSLLWPGPRCRWLGWSWCCPACISHFKKWFKYLKNKCISHFKKRFKTLKTKRWRQMGWSCQRTLGWWKLKL